MIFTLLIIIDNHRLPFNHRQKVYPNGTLTISEVERSADEGKYKCTALGSASRSSLTSSSSSLNEADITSSAAKSASSSFHLSVRVKPAIDPFVFPKSLQQSQRYTILCSVSSGDLPVQIKWLKDGRRISSSNGLNPDFTGIGVINVSPFASNLVFESLRPEHMGNYTCEASNRAGTAFVTQSMVVHGMSPFIINKIIPLHVHARLGSI